MDRLATNMSAITEFSANISCTLQDRRQQITKFVRSSHASQKSTRVPISDENISTKILNQIFVGELCCSFQILMRKLQKNSSVLEYQ